MRPESDGVGIFGESGASRPARGRRNWEPVDPSGNGAVVTTSSNGTATVNGVLATHSQVTEVIPAGAIGNAQPITTSRITYVSPDLKLPVQIKTTDPRVGSSDMELTNISTGEPSAALFTGAELVTQSRRRRTRIWVGDAVDGGPRRLWPPGWIHRRRNAVKRY